MELGVQGEDLVATAGRDNEYGSSQDEYDYSDNFIDDGPLETGSSSESSSEDGGGSSGDDACYNGDDYVGTITKDGDRRDKVPDARYERVFSSDDSDADESNGKEGIWRPSKRVKKRESPSAAHEVVKCRVRGKEPTSSSSRGKRGPGITSKATAAAKTDSYAETKECKENPASRVETRREQVDKKGVVRSEEELQGEETISSLRPSRTPAVHWQQSGSSLDSDTGVPRKGGKEGIESERRILERFGHAAQRRREGR
ncbi:hypothetical protein Q5P01_010532 [Channa striata]|uniref:Uncharacterized protein n=1 Tax=Channa striata TaxID=64152 RepID=A0AA88N1P7_CHASR|nr:hypothetical protein Q5P01_010532 [Channa striata]